MKEKLLHSGIVRSLGKSRAEDIFRKIKKFLRVKDRILDIGAGTCQVTELLRLNNFNVIPLDVVNESLADGITPVIYDGKHVPFKNNEFDVSLLVNILHHIKKPEDVLKEAKRVSKRLIVMEDVYGNNLQKYATFVMDSISNLEFVGHPHSNKSGPEWKEAFCKLNLKLTGEEEDMFWGYFRSALYILEK